MNLAEKKRGAPTKEERLEKERAKIEEEKQLMKWKKSADELKALKDSYDALKADYDNLLEENDKLKRTHIAYATEENKMKKVLELRARNDDAILIKDKMEYIGMGISLGEIEEICKNIDVLPIELRNYYADCGKEYEKEIELNPSILKRKNLENNLFLIDETKKDIARCNDDEARRKLFQDLDKYTLSNVKILEGGIVTDKEDEKVDNVVNIMMEDYEKQKKSSVVRLNLGEIKAI